MSQNTKIHELACELLAGKREGWVAHPLEIGDQVFVCAVDRGERDADSVYAWISNSIYSDVPFLVWIFRPEDNGEPVSTNTVSATELEDHVFNELAHAERGRLPEAAGESALGGRRSHFRRDEDRDRSNALQQIREIAQFPMGASLTHLGEQLRWTKAKLERIANIAEAGEPDENWPERNCGATR
jgi:hypothetical protein